MPAPPPHVQRVSLEKKSSAVRCRISYRATISRMITESMVVSIRLFLVNSLSARTISGIPPRVFEK